MDAPQEDERALERVLLQVAERLHDNYPYFHPLYAGQMLKPPHPVAVIGYLPDADTLVVEAGATLQHDFRLRLSPVTLMPTIVTAAFRMLD